VAGVAHLNLVLERHADDGRRRSRNLHRELWDRHCRQRLRLLALPVTCFQLHATGDWASLGGAEHRLQRLTTTARQARQRPDELMAVAIGRWIGTDVLQIGWNGIADGDLLRRPLAGVASVDRDRHFLAERNRRRGRAAEAQLSCGPVDARLAGSDDDAGTT